MTTYCDFSTSLTCPTCGYRAKRRPTYRVCRPVPPKAWRPFQVGDFVERTLTRVGITKERVERWTRTEGKPGGCGCEGRKKWLNEAGDRVQYAVRRRLLQLRDFYLPPAGCWQGGRYGMRSGPPLKNAVDAPRCDKPR